MSHPTSLVIILGCFMLLRIFSLPAAADNNDTIGSGQIRLSCGASSPNATDGEGRTWDSDDGSKFAPSPNGIARTASYQDASLASVVPYMNARIFTSNYTYSFPVRPGLMFVRLYFYPATYGNDYVPANAYFGASVASSSNLTLLHNFNASQTSLARNTASLVLEYSVNVTASRLELTFYPSTQHNGSYAFVNGIEIVHTPDLFTTPTPTLANGGSPNPFHIDPSIGFQTVHRLNVGGPPISAQGDAYFYRSWEDDVPYVGAAGVLFGKDKNVSIAYTAGVPNYTAPVDVYATARSMGPNPQGNLNFNLTWIFSVDAVGL